MFSRVKEIIDRLLEVIIQQHTDIVMSKACHYNRRLCTITKSGTANLQIDPIKPLPDDAILDTEENTMLDNFMLLADFETSLSHRNKEGPVNSIPSSTKSKTWQEIEREE